MPPRRGEDTPDVYKRQAKSRAACPGQPYLPMHDLEKLVQSKLQTYTPQPLTYALRCV